uniref:Nephrocystin 4 n=1 Tax=Cyclopterus lumpus TaxID=8103 RepID=A0A8C3G6E9_CYCLU
MSFFEDAFTPVLYFHTSLRLPSAVMVLELVSLSDRPDGSQQALGRGFTVLELFTNRPEVQASDGVQRLNLHHGSPRSLLHPLLKDTVDCKELFFLNILSHLDCVIKKHPALAPAMHLLPENVLLSGNENVPGLAASPTGDALLRPQLLKTLPFTLNRLTISLQPSLEKFESQLLQLINADCHNTKQPGPEGTVRTVVIQERRLHVGVHNGWCFLDKPQVVVLEPLASGSRGRSDSTSKQSTLGKDSNIAHLEMDLQREGDASQDEGDQLQELPFTPVHAPVITLGMNMPSSCSVSSRSSLAHLYSAGFPDIADSAGQAAEVLDPTEPVPFDPQREESGPLQGDLLVFQFLAFTRTPAAGVGPDWPENIHFTFQFYRFPPVTSQQLKLLASDKVQQKACVPLPCVLASINRDGTVNSGPPGLQVQFRADGGFLKAGEKRWFLRYLALHTMHIDIWDSDSLLLIGSTAVELKYMLRQGKSAVQALHELEVLTTDYVGEDALLTSAHDRTKEARLARELHQMKPSERHSKAEGIANMLSQAITTQHLLYANLGTAEYMEFVLKNPFNVPQTVTIHSDDPELRAITNTEEWGYFKALSKSPTPLEENMFHLEEGAPGPRVYLRPKESIHIPLKYQSFLCDHTMALQVQWGREFDADATVRNAPPQKLLQMVTFTAEDGKPMAICQVNVEPTAHVVDQTFRLYHPELCFLKKAIRLPPWDDPTGAAYPDVRTHISVRCSDPNIICQTRMLAPGEPQDVYLKVPGSPSPNIKMFFVMVFTDKWMAAPSQIWQIYVHFLERVDVSCVTGQRSCQSLVLRGKQAVRKVKCFSSHPQEIEVDPEGVFVLPPAAVQELQLKVQPWRAGSRFLYVNAVDVENRRLVTAWLLCLNVHRPVLSKAFEVCVPVGGGRGSSRKITYTNPYTNSRSFLLRSDHPDLLQFKEEKFQISGGESYTIGLRFAPSQSPGSVEILVYVNNLEEKTEETFCVKVNYS